MDNSATPAEVDETDQLGLAPKREGLHWELCLLAQTLEFSDDVRTLIQRGANEIERLRRGECVCIKCGLRQEKAHQDEGDDPPFLF